MSATDEQIVGVLNEHATYEWWPMTREFICTCEASVGTSYPHVAHRAHVAAALTAAGIGVIADAKAEGVNEGVRLAAQLVRDHVITDLSDPIADFLIARADRVRPEASR